MILQSSAVRRAGPAPWVGILLGAAFFAPGATGAVDFRRGETVNIQGEFNDNLYAAGGTVNANLQSSDDVFLAGGQVNFEGRAEEGIHAAGGEVSITRAQLRELIVAGGTVRVDDTEVRDDVVAAGGQLRFGPASRVLGSATLMGGEILLAGQVTGDVEVYANRLRLEPSAVIQGDLRHRTGSIDIAPGAQIRGQTIAQAPRGGEERRPWVGVMPGILFYLGGLLVPPILASLFPGIANRGRNQIFGNFWATLGKGTVTALLLPMACLVLLMSVVGTPLGLVMIPLLAIGAVLAWSVAAYTVGDWLRIRTKRGTVGTGAPTRKERFGWAFLATLLLSALLWIPVLGWIFTWIVFLAGVGALYALSRDEMRRKPSPGGAESASERAA